MLAPLFDIPVGVSSASGHYRRPEIVVNTPYHKVKEDSRFQYRFVDGFYESEKSTFTNPLVELRRNEIIRHVQQVLDRWNAVVEKFTDVNAQVLIGVSTKLLLTLLTQGFVKVTFKKTLDDSLLMTGEWQGKLIYIDIFFDEEELDGYEAILNVYDQKLPVLTKFGTIEDIYTRLFGELPNWWNQLATTAVMKAA